MSRPSQFKEFWKLLGRFEHLTVQETLKIQSLDFGALEDSQREKGSLVEVLQELGGRLGLDRSNRDLRLRLETLEQMERRNLDQITASLDAARGQRRDAERTRVNLRSLRSSYLSGSASGEFFAEG
jgi:hypothetical protein